MSDKELVTFTIDGQTVQAATGTTVLEAARSIGIEIPHYCYHPGLSIVGSCRMCLVEVEKIPKLQPSCATPIARGMVVRTRTPEVLRNRQSVLEFLLLNHPLDCPVCDQSGECELQNYYMDHGCYDPRFNENKKKRRKALPIGPHVILDQERCILCTRCVRFTQEISKSAELAVHERGHLSEIAIFPGAELDNPYSGNVVDLCPVGALTDRDFRFQCRVWFLGSASSICPGCSRGCNIEIHFNERFNPRYHSRRVHRLKPRFNPEVNRYWMCDEGRYSYHAIDAPERLRVPSLKQEGVHRTAGWDEAVARTAVALKRTVEKFGPQAVAVLASPQMTNEELFQMDRLFRTGLNVKNFEYRVPQREVGYSDGFLVTADKNPNAFGAEVMGFAGAGSDKLLQACAEGQVRFLYICHHDLTRGHDANLAGNALANLDFVAFHGAFAHATAGMADVQLPSALYAEKTGTFTNFQGRVQRIHAAIPPLEQSLPDLEIFAQLAAALGVALPVVSAEQVFQEIGTRFLAFAGMDYATVGESGQMLKLG
ncbi:MAG: (2Fe-2S)-binding protein [Acidobacteriia bacterium]|nr:(2Fe-2S)-binding protein [Terriglobia bacterium]